MVRLLGKSMQNMSETSLKSAYPTPWVKSTVAWHCRLISSKMKWTFPEECPCYTLTIPMSGFLTLSDLKPCVYRSISFTLFGGAGIELGGNFSSWWEAHPPESNKLQN